MATTILFSPWWLDEFDSGVAGAAIITPQGVAIDNTLVSAVQAAATAAGIAVTTAGAGGAAMAVLEDVYTGATAPTGNNQLWIDISTPTTPTLKWWNGSAWVATSGSGGGGGAVASVNGQTGTVTLTAAGLGAAQIANDGSDFANIDTTRYNLHIGQFQAQTVYTTNQALTGQPTNDGYTPTNNDVVLLVGQTDKTQNGPQKLPPTGTGPWARPADCPSGGVIKGRLCLINGGTTLAGTIWSLEATANITVDSDQQNWVAEYTMLPATGPTHTGQILKVTTAGTVPVLAWQDRLITFGSNVTGLISAAPGFSSNAILGQARFPVKESATYSSLVCSLSTLNTDNDLTIDILKNGTSIFTTSAHKPVFSHTGSSHTAIPSGAPDTLTVAANDFLTVNIAYAGTVAADLTIFLDYAATS